METLFTAKEQTAHRNAFIAEAHQKAWAAACHADFISKNLNELIGRYQKLQAEDREHENAIKTNADGLDSHTVENRNNRNELQKKRTGIAQEMKAIATNTQQGAQSMQKLLDSVDQNLLLAEHAKDWSWKQPVDKEEQNETVAE
jgi:hypothetical protein